MAPKKQKDKWRKAFDKRERNLEDSKAPKEPSEQSHDAKETPSPGVEGKQGACGTSAHEKPGGTKRQGRFAKKQMEAKMHGRYQGRKEAGPGDNFNKPKQARKGRGRGVSLKHCNSQEPSLNGRGKPSDINNRDQRPGRPHPVTEPSSVQQNARPISRGVFQGTRNCLDLKTLKDKSVTEVVQKLSDCIAQLTYFLRSKDEQHNTDEFVFDLTCALAIACRAPPGEKANKILAVLKGSVFWEKKIPRLLSGIGESKAFNDHDSRQNLLQSLITVSTRYLAHLPSAYGDPPYDELKQALDQSSVDRKRELEKELDSFKKARDDIIRGERQKQGKRCRIGDKPPNDFRKIPICPTYEEITTQERPFLRKNISKGRYQNAEHYLDVQFRLLREDFIEPLREGITEIVQNVPREQRKQLMKIYRGVRIFHKEFTWSGIIHHIQIDVTGLNTDRLVNSKRLLFGSFLCLSTNNFKTMLFATVSKRDPDALKKGRIDIRFMENQDVFGIENRNCVYQMVESPAYFEACHHVLKGLKELDETTLPFQKYLVECSGIVDPPEYIRRNDTLEEPVCYDLSKALGIPDISNYTAVPILQAGAWPSVKGLPLNNSQFDALRTAITTEFCVIQGPPGTGKTYVGAKIVRCLLENRNVWDPRRTSPMLMVCYTNHALDQFLEKVLEFLPKEEIIRVGSRSRNQALEGCNLTNYSTQCKTPEKHKVRRRMWQITQEMEKWKKCLAEADNRLLEFEDLEELLHSAYADQLFNAIFPSDVAIECQTPGNTFKLWLCDNEHVGSCNKSTKAATEDKTDTFEDGSIAEESSVNEECYSVPLLIERHHSSNLQTPETGELLKDVDASNTVTQTHLQSTEDFPKQQTLKSNCHATASPRSVLGEGRNGKNQSSSNESGACLDVESELAFTTFQRMSLIGDGCSSKVPESRQSRGKHSDEDGKAVSEAGEETFQIQDSTPRQEQSKEKEEQDIVDAWVAVPYRKKGKTTVFPWLKTGGEKSGQMNIKSHQIYDAEIEDQMPNASMTTKTTIKTNSSLENQQFSKDADIIKELEGPQTEKDRADEHPVRAREADEETITIEREADLIQQQRWIQGDEDLLKVISEKSDDLKRQEQKKAEKDGDISEEWQTVRYRKRGRTNLFPWQIQEHESSKERKPKNHQIYNVEINDKTAEINSSRKKKNSKRNQPSQRYITGDISSLKQDLNNAEIMSTDDALDIDNIWNLSGSDRLRLYLFWTDNYRERCRVQIQRAEQEYKQLHEELEELRFEGNEEIIRRATVVGMTTSGAARYHSVLQRISPQIVVIEEAAEVMEAHIITSLSQNTKHTILIGDHKQLRPKATVYELARKYNLEVSLFERMVMNQMECKCLSTQHRMRPEIAALTKRIYEHVIVDHESVCHYPNVAGVCKNMFFIDHCLPETRLSGLESYSNSHEVEFLVALCKYLLGQGYNGRQITVLTMYIGQLLLFKERMPRSTFKGVNVCSVDNFQGEENDIILLSLVRSNSEDRIGFLSESNRVCVALSRARQGLYCIGNFSLLKRQSKLWKEICDDLKQKNAIADNLALVCATHSNITNVKQASDFNLAGGCNMPCGVRLSCGHACGKQCHNSNHREGECLKICPNRCPNEHPCLNRCHYPAECPSCLQKMPKTVPRCGHEQQIPCSVKAEEFSCQAQCENVLPCKHKCGNECGQQCTTECQVICVKSLPCGHEKRLQCCKNPAVHNQCNNNCVKLLDCGHPCSKKCKEKCQCNAKIEVQLPCEHMKTIFCREKGYPKQCFEKCKRKLNCGHECPGICNADCKMQRCKVSVVKVLPCGHRQSIPCYQDPQTAFCYAPCPRQLECGHKCSSVCGRLCHEVRCEERCETNCERGHPCKKRCHFGSACGDCKVEIEMTLPTCGHSITKPCCVDPATLKCKQPCERMRSCGHPCKEICGRKCEAQLCKVQVTRALSCKHVVTLECHKSPENHHCKEVLEVTLPCGHKTSLECHATKAGIGNISCKEKVLKDLSCGHKLILPCFKNPEGCTCRKQSDIQLRCGHTKSLPCSTVTAGLSDFQCKVNVEKTLPCDHKATLPCYSKPEEYNCKEEVEITLSCGHQTVTTCFSMQDELQGGICRTEVTRKLHCGHEKKMLCSSNPNKVFCDAPCEKYLQCGHLCSKKCGDDCSRFKCAVRVEKKLSCGQHNMNCLCSEDVSQRACLSQCERSLTCGHQCPGKCSEDCRQYKCTKLVIKNLNCAGNHSCKIPCCKDPSRVPCQERCVRNLQCGHPCPGLCSEPCESTKCKQRVEKQYPDCGHKEQMKCFESKYAFCQLPCRRREKCKHLCKGVCGKPCSDYPCDIMVSKMLACGHKVKRPCSYSVADVRCPAQCGTKLPCGHQCSGKCDDCHQRGSHEMCRRPCSRLLICLHRCQANCSEPCPPCDKECRRRCPHAKCTKRCSQLCEPCKQPCSWSCPHYQCSNPCGEECDRPRCDAPCPKTLACQHPCIGLCGENCPTLCAICDAKKLSSMLGGASSKLTESTRYLQLFDCGHILTVDEMDSWMMRALGSDVQLIQCPRCSSAISFSFRYGNLIKRTLKSNESVKKEIHVLADEAAQVSKRLLEDEKNLRYALRKMKFPKDVLDALQRQHFVGRFRRWFLSEIPDGIHVRSIPFIFTLKSHLLIMHGVYKAQLKLQKVKRNHVSSKHQLEMEEQSVIVKQSLDSISEYLVKPQLDLSTLHQVHEHTRKFSLFASILEARHEAMKCQRPLSSISETRLKMASDRLNLFLQGKDDALQVDWLERIVSSLRKEVGLAPLPPEEPETFENFPGFSNEVWKLCEHREVYFTRSVVRAGDDVLVVSKSCRRCAQQEQND